MDEKAMLKRYLDSLRSDVVWKLEGLAEWQLRWPMTSTGTNLLGIVKHLAAMEYGYLGVVFDRPGEELPWMGSDADPHADMWATSEESLEDIVRLYRRAVAHGDETVAELEVDSRGSVPWWPEPEVTLGRVLVHLAVETARHVGHIDVLRERLDGRVGLHADNPNLPLADEFSWADHVEHLREVAVQAQWPGARQGLYAFAGPGRDALLAPILTGEKTTTSSLLQAWRHDGEALPVAGEYEVLISSEGMPVGITETTDVRVVNLDEVDLDHALGEGEGFTTVEQWRTAHEQFWTCAEVRAELDEPDFVPDDSTQVVLQSFRLVERL